MDDNKLLSTSERIDLSDKIMATREELKGISNSVLLFRLSLENEHSTPSTDTLDSVLYSIESHINRIEKDLENM